MQTEARPTVEHLLGAVVMLGVAALVAVEVIARYVVGHSVGWSEELVRYLFVLLTFLALSGNIASGDHLSARLLPDTLRARMLGTIRGTRLVVIVGFCAFVCVAGVDAVIALAQSDYTTPALRWPRWVVVAVVPITMAAAVYRAVRARR